VKGVSKMSTEEPELLQVEAACKTCRGNGIEEATFQSELEYLAHLEIAHPPSAATEEPTT
jgi:hypothetical protein